MSLAVIGDGASYEFRWRRWALLRDTVAMTLEQGTSGTRFPRLASLGDALVGSLHIDARELAAEVAEVRRALAGRPLGELAIGPKTASVLYMGARLEAPRPLTPGELAQISPPGPGDDLAAYFGSMLDSLADVCARAAADGTVEVIDG